MSPDFWWGFLVGVIAAFVGSFVLGMLLMGILSRLNRRAEMAEERVWTGDDLAEMLRPTRPDGDE